MAPVSISINAIPKNQDKDNSKKRKQGASRKAPQIACGKVAVPRHMQ